MPSLPYASHSLRESNKHSSENKSMTGIYSPVGEGVESQGVASKILTEIRPTDVG